VAARALYAVGRFGVVLFCLDCGLSFGVGPSPTERAEKYVASDIQPRVGLHVRCQIFCAAIRLGPSGGASRKTLWPRGDPSCSSGLFALGLPCICSGHKMRLELDQIYAVGCRGSVWYCILGGAIVWWWLRTGRQRDQAIFSLVRGCPHSPDAD
jgi:hypothetical protein